MSPSLSAQQLLAWNDHTATRWRTFLADQPAALQLPCDISGTHTLAELLRHITVTELRYAELLVGLPPSDYPAIQASTTEQIFDLHDRAFVLFRSALQSPAFDPEQPLEFPTLTQGRRRASGAAVLFHALLHGIRHYAQIGTLARQAGLPNNFPGDYLPMASERIDL